MKRQIYTNILYIYFLPKWDYLISLASCYTNYTQRIYRQSLVKNTYKQLQENNTIVQFPTTT